MTISRITTVITPATDRNLATRELFKLTMKLSDGADDDYIEFLLKSKSRSFEQACNRVFAQETLQDEFRIRRPVFSPIDGRVDPLVLSRRPVESIVSVADYSGTLDPSLYEFDPDTGFLTRLYDPGNGVMCPIGWRPGTVTVQFVAGYVLPAEGGGTLPEDIQEAVMTMVRASYKARERDPAMRGQSDGGIGNQSFWLGIPPDVMATVANYRDIKFGG